MPSPIIQSDGPLDREFPRDEQTNEENARKPHNQVNKTTRIPVPFPQWHLWKADRLNRALPRTPEYMSLSMRVHKTPKSQNGPFTCKKLPIKHLNINKFHQPTKTGHPSAQILFDGRSDKEVVPVNNIRR